MSTAIRLHDHFGLFLSLTVPATIVASSPALRIFPDHFTSCCCMLKLISRTLRYMLRGHRGHRGQRGHRGHGRGYYRPTVDSTDRHLTPRQQINKLP